MKPKLFDEFPLYILFIFEVIISNMTMNTMKIKFKKHYIFLMGKNESDNHISTHKCDVLQNRLISCINIKYIYIDAYKIDFTEKNTK